MSESETEFRQTLQDCLEAWAELEGDLDVVSVRSFEEDGVLSTNEGFVVRLADASAFQVTVVQSAWPDRERDPEEGCGCSPTP